MNAFDIDRGYIRPDKLSAIDEQLDIVTRDRDFYKQELADLRKTATGTVAGWTVDERQMAEALYTAWQVGRNETPWNALDVLSQGLCLSYAKTALDYLRDKALFAVPAGVTPEWLAETFTNAFAELYPSDYRLWDRIDNNEWKDRRISVMSRVLAQWPTSAPAPVPAGVPSVEDLAAIHAENYGRTGFSGVAAVRDAVLRGVYAERQALRDELNRAKQDYYDEERVYSEFRTACYDALGMEIGEESEFSGPDSDLVAERIQALRDQIRQISQHHDEEHEQRKDLEHELQVLHERAEKAERALELQKVTAGSPLRNTAPVFFTPPDPKPAPIDPDAWKTEFKESWFSVKAHDRYVTLNFPQDTGDYHLGTMRPHKCAEFAVWLASYSAAHGCPVELHRPTIRERAESVGIAPLPPEIAEASIEGETQTVAAPDDLAALAEIGYRAYRRRMTEHHGEAECQNWDTLLPAIKDGVLAQTAAILRAAKPTIEATGDDIERDCFMGQTQGLIATMDHDDLIEWCNSRIRWTVPTYTEADVEALAKVLCDDWAKVTRTNHEWETVEGMHDIFLSEASAAIAHLGGRVEG